MPTIQPIFEILFDSKTGTLHLPTISIDVNTEVMLRNLMAYESVVLSGPLVFTSYVELMNGIVDTAKDAKVLRRREVIFLLGSQSKDDESGLSLFASSYDDSIHLLKLASTNVEVGPPNSLLPRGRLKKRRIPSFPEGTSKSKTNHKCSRYGELGHHRSTCKNPLTVTSEEVSTRMDSRQKLPIRRQDDAHEF